MDELKKELETYRVQLPALLENEGQFVVIAGKSVLGFHPNFESALKAGYEKMGLEDFLVKKIEAVETVHFITPNFAL
jgi:hypothetical protein